MRAVIAQVWRPGHAPPAPSASGHDGRDDVVARGEVVNPGPDFLDDAGTFVTPDDREAARRAEPEMLVERHRPA